MLDALIFLLPLIETCSHHLRRMEKIKTCPLTSSEALSAECAVMGMTQPVHKAYDSVQWQYSSHSPWVHVQPPSDTLDPIILAALTFNTNHCSQLTAIYISCEDRWTGFSIARFLYFASLVLASRSLLLKLIVFTPVNIFFVGISMDRQENVCLNMWCETHTVRYYGWNIWSIWETVYKPLSP